MTAPRTARVVAAAVALAVLSSAAGCTSNGKEQQLPTKHQADVVATLKTYGQSTASVVGAPLDNWDAVPAPCEGRNGELATDGRFFMTGNANIAAAPDQHIAILQKLRDQWKQQGYEITEFRTFAPDNNRGVVSVRNPADGVTISVHSTEPPQAFALLIATPCYLPAPGEHPAG
jgi:hypothetical protein